MTDVDRGEGYAFRLTGGKLQVNLVDRWLDDAIRVETERPLVLNRWHHVAVTYDGSRSQPGCRSTSTASREKLKVLLDELNQTFKTQAAACGSAAAAARTDRFHGLIADVRIYDDCSAAEDVQVLAVAEPVSATGGHPAGRSERRPGSASCEPVSCDQLAPEAGRELVQRAARAGKKDASACTRAVPTTMVMEEMPTPRDSFVLMRGEYDKRGEKVVPGVPAVLSPLPAGAGKNNRLGLAAGWSIRPTR